MHGFVRDSAGNFRTFDAPGATNTYANGIDASGLVAGTFVDASQIAHGFERSANGAIVTFDPPGSMYTEATCVNDKSVIAGTYTGSNYAGHGFVRAADGSFTSFDLPNATDGPYPVSINTKGAIAGQYGDSNLPVLWRIRWKLAKRNLLHFRHDQSCHVGIAGEAVRDRHTHSGDGNQAREDARRFGERGRGRPLGLPD